MGCMVQIGVKLQIMLIHRGVGECKGLGSFQNCALIFSLTNSPKKGCGFRENLMLLGFMFLCSLCGLL